MKPSTTPGYKHRTGLILVLILAVAFGLRLQQISQPFVDAFSWRQASTAMMALNFYRGEWNIFLPQVDWTGPGPNYRGREFQTVTWLVACVWKIIGQHDIVGRLVGVLAGTWGVFAFFQLVRRVWDTQSALCAAAVLALLPGAVFIDRSFLPDPTMLSLLLTGLWLLLAWLQSQRRPIGLLSAALAILTLAILTKLPAAVALVPITYSVVVILSRRGLWSTRRMIMAATLSALALLPIAAYYAWTIYVGKTYPPHHIAGAGNWVWEDGWRKWIGEGYYLPWGWYHVTSWIWTWPVIMLAGLGLIIAPGTLVKSNLRAEWFFHAWLAGGVILWLLAARELTENVWNFHVLNPPIAAFAGFAISRVVELGIRTSSAPSRSLTILLRSGAILLFLLIYGQKSLRPMFQDYASQGRAMGLALRELSAPNELVVVMANDVGDPIPIYFAQRRGWVFPPAGPHGYRWNFIPQRPSECIAMLDSLRNQGARWFGIVADPRDDTRGREEFWKNHQEFADHLMSRFEMVAKTSDYVIFKLPAPSAASR